MFNNIFDLPWKLKNKVSCQIIYQDNTSRIITISGISHSTSILPYLRKTDIVFVVFPCCPIEMYEVDMTCVKYFNLNPDNFYLLLNQFSDIDVYKSFGFKNSIFCNHNCFLDENIYCIKDNVVKKYDAVFVTRPSPFKRSYLSELVKNKAIICGNVYNNRENIDLRKISHSYINDKFLTQEEMVLKYNESKCSLCLSSYEGGCFSSSESLLCGVPVVSTHSLGGRDVFYDDYNSIVCTDDQGKIRDSVELIIRSNLNPYKIRNDHLKISKEHRKVFLSALNDIFVQLNRDINCELLFKDLYHDKFIENYISIEDAIEMLEDRELIVINGEEKMFKTLKIFSPTVVFGTQLNSSWSSNIKTDVNDKNINNNKIPFLSELYEGKAVLDLTPKDSSQYSIYVPIKKDWLTISIEDTDNLTLSFSIKILNPLAHSSEISFDCEKEIEVTVGEEKEKKKQSISSNTLFIDDILTSAEGWQKVSVPLSEFMNNAPNFDKKLFKGFRFIGRGTSQVLLSNIVIEESKQ